MTETAEQGRLQLIWWNINDFYHFEPAKVTKEVSSRWPQSRDAYEEKCNRVDKALGALFAASGRPTILALGEITSEAAEGIRDRLLPNHQLISLDVKKDAPSLQVAILFDDKLDTLKFEEKPPIVVPSTPMGTRAMAVLDIITKNSRIRCLICHWPARFDEDKSELVRYRISDYVAQYSHDFLNEDLSEDRHLTIIGDLNDEPYDQSLTVLNAHRYRGRAQGKSHWSSDQVKRTHLYNTSWRLLGEKHPHPSSNLAVLPMGNSAGTYYWATKRSWLHLDHLIVSGGLLGPTVPYLDESEVTIVSLPEFLNDGFPEKFSKDAHKYHGLSDHLPIYAMIHI